MNTDERKRKFEFQKEIGLRDGAYIEKKLNIFSEGFICGMLTGIGIFTISLILLKFGGMI